ncbi:MAG TPA: aminotransferase class V-fold PLP-dependent enzyme, partial [Arenibaculum sp.]|nr:aminotransferase class V-fold PLP-dependent enzyme [Arenibaculum sp.]
PRFWGYITSSAAPIGALGDFLAATVNPNVGGWPLSPMATEIERQTVKWIAELIGYPSDCGGLLVSGGNMANFVGFLAARKARAGWDIRAHGTAGDSPLRVYASEETHTWSQKAADLFGLGTDSIRWIPTDGRLRLDTGKLLAQIKKDRQAGARPLLVVGTAGSVSSGAIDPLPEIASICRDHELWFHVDGAYGGVAAVLPEASADLRGLRLADSVAVDPHKWLYAPIEAGCTLVRNPAHLLDAFSYRPPYYHLKYESADPETNYFEQGPQNTRGFRALKVWLGLKQVGRQGYVTMIRDDIRLAGDMHRAVAAHPEFEMFHQELSISTFRYVPRRLSATRGEPETEAWLNRLNAELLGAIHASGELYLTNAVIDGRFVLRACIVNFRTSRADVEAVPSIVARLGAVVDERLGRES